MSCSNQLLQAILVWNGIVVHAPDPISATLVRFPNACIETTRATKVGLRNYGKGSLAEQPLSRPVGTVVVYDNNSVNRVCLLLDRLNAFLQQWQTIMGYDNRINSAWRS